MSKTKAKPRSPRRSLPVFLWEKSTKGSIMKRYLISLAVILVAFLFVKMVSSISSRNLSTTFTITRITSDDLTQSSPSVWDNITTWSDLRTHNGLNIWLYDQKTKTQTVLVERAEDQTPFGVWRNKIIYLDNSDTLPVMRVRDINTFEDVEIAEGEQLAGGAIYANTALYVIGENQDLYAYNLQNGEKRLLASHVVNPRLWDNKVVWTSVADDSSNIRGYDLNKNSTFDIATVNNGHQQDPDIYGDAVTWVDYSDGRSKIMEKNLVTDVVRIIAEAEDDRLSRPTISNQYIAWVDDMGTDTPNLFVYSQISGQIIQLTDYDLNQSSPIIPELFKDTLVWASSHSGNGDIYTAEMDH